MHVLGAARLSSFFARHERCTTCVHLKLLASKVHGSKPSLFSSMGCLQTQHSSSICTDDGGLSAQLEISALPAHHSSGRLQRDASHCMT